MNKQNVQAKQQAFDSGTILPSHTTTDADELMAMMFLEEICDKPFRKSESPDLYSEDNSIGCEVTRAYPPAYEKYNGKMLSNMRKNIVDDTALPKVFSAAINAVMSRIQDRVIDKMHKLYKYKEYPTQCLYVKAFMWISYFELHTLPDMFDSLKAQIISKCQESYDSEYKEYHVLFIECRDMLIVWDWVNDKLTLRPDIFDKYEKFDYDAFCLIKNEMYNGISAVDNTPYKTMSKLFSERKVDYGDYRNNNPQMLCQKCNNDKSSQ